MFRFFVKSRAYTEHKNFLCVSQAEVPKRFMKAQLLEQCMVPRPLFGGVEYTSKSVYSSNSQLLLSRPSVSGAYSRNTQGKQLLGYELYCFQYVATVVFFIGISCTVSSIQLLMLLFCFLSFSCTTISST